MAQGGSVTKASSRKRSKASPLPVEPTLIEPSILSIAPRVGELIRSGTLATWLTEEDFRKITQPLGADEIAKSISAGTGWPLHSFLESPSLTKLAEVLRSHPNLYWHPIVERQIRYLQRLQSEEEEWRRLGWQWHSEWDGEYEIYTPPQEVALVKQQLENLVEAHACGLLPRTRIRWERAKMPRGPRGGLEIQPPSLEGLSKQGTAELLEMEFRLLREVFKIRLRSARDKPVTKKAAKEWYQKLVQEVLPMSLGRAISHPKQLNLESALDAMLDGKIGHEGKPADLAYVALGALLSTTPRKIRNTIDNYRYPRRVKASR